MPIQRTTKDGKPGYKYGPSGKVYTYTPGSKASRERARKKAERQRQAVRSTGWRE